MTPPLGMTLRRCSGDQQHPVHLPVLPTCLLLFLPDGSLCRAAEQLPATACLSPHAVTASVFAARLLLNPVHRRRFTAAPAALTRTCPGAGGDAGRDVHSGGHGRPRAPAFLASSGQRLAPQPTHVTPGCFAEGGRRGHEEERASTGRPMHARGRCPCSPSAGWPDSGGHVASPTCSTP